MLKAYHSPTLYEFITLQQTAFPYAKSDLSRLLNHINLASKMVNREVIMAGLTEILGKTGIHQRVAFFAGSRNMVDKAEEFLKNEV